MTDRTEDAVPEEEKKEVSYGYKVETRNCVKLLFGQKRMVRIPEARISLTAIPDASVDGAWNVIVIFIQCDRYRKSDEETWPSAFYW